MYHKIENVMKNNFYLIFIFLISIVYSKAITIEQVESVAQNFLLSRASNSQLYSLKNIEKDNYLNIVHLNPHGYLIISDDDEAIPILGYSFESNIDLDNMPTQLSGLFVKYNLGIDYIVQNNLLEDENVRNLWNNYLEGPYRENNFREISPLISANWNQGGQWNDLCPGSSLVGCVAVAMGQVMYYWNYPIQGSGYSQYFDPQHGILSVVYDEYSYNYNNMFDNEATYDSQLLLYHAGMSVHMDYSPWASGASVCWEGPSAQAGLDENFNYHDDINCEVKINYEDDAWHDLIFEQLFRGWPMVYRGYSDDAGHAWNIDGYQENYFHCNWGWGGSANGYFYFDSLNGGGYNFIDNQAALLNIAPDNLLQPVALFDFIIDDKVLLLNDLSSNINEDNIVYYQWDFGDMNTSAEVSPQHTYENYGTYEVSLKVMSEYGMYSEEHYEVVSIIDLTGDVNNDFQVNILDIVYLVDLILSSTDFIENIDLNQDESINILDVILLVQIILD